MASYNETMNPIVIAVRRFPLIAFFLLVFGLTWPLLIADAVGSHRIPATRVPVPLQLLISYQPTVAALLVTWVTGGGSAVRSLLRGLLRWRVGLGWYALAVLGPGLFWLLVVALAAALDGRSMTLLSPEVAGWSTPKLLLSFLPLFLVTTVVNGEEIAWRGFALPRLQADRSALTASLILGIVWGLFHLPLFWTAGSSQASQSIAGFVAGTMALAVVFTWVYNGTSGSILLAYLLHGSINTWTRVLAVAQGGPTVLRIQLVLMVIVAIALIVRFGPARLADAGPAGTRPAPVGG
jgi:membrane protease YdiL (CAAX protease family)